MSAEIQTLHTPFARHLDDEGIEYIRARSDRESTIEKGWPDFSLLATDRAGIYIEFKDKDGKETPDQRKVRERLTSKGFKCFVVRSLSVAIELVTQWRSGVQSPLVAPPARREPTIRQYGQRGDYVCDGDTRIRRAEIADLRDYQRGTPLDQPAG